MFFLIFISSQKSIKLGGKIVKKERNMIERLKYWLQPNRKSKKQCSSCCLICEYYEACRKDS